MVRALIDYHRQRTAQKRGGDLVRVTLTRIGDAGAPSVDVEKLPPLLEELHALDERKAEIVQLRVFWGMTIGEVAEVMEISASTVDRDWRFAQRWLANRLRNP
jgi:RNA polymerase sigma factor (TIGR02999 family)